VDSTRIGGFHSPFLLEVFPAFKKSFSLSDCQLFDFLALKTSATADVLGNGGWLKLILLGLTARGADPRGNGMVIIMHKSIFTRWQ
jgi:hypothetical protein